MLIIFYGGIAEIGKRCRGYLEKAGFAVMEKYNYAPQKALLTSKYTPRNFVSREEFYEKTDSLFRYEVGGVQIGFHQQQIMDAVSDKTHSLLTLSTKDISFLAQIKQVYAEKAHLIYGYIDDTTLKSVIDGLDGITPEEAAVRFQTGQDVKKAYLEHREIFDDVVIYGGEDSCFDLQALDAQLEKIVRKVRGSQAEEKAYADVFISCPRKDEHIYEALKKALNEKGISVFDDRKLPVNSDYMAVLPEAIRNAKIVVPVITNNAFSSMMVKREIHFAVENAWENGTVIMPVVEENADFDQSLGLKLMLSRYAFEPLRYDQYEETAQSLAKKLHKLLSAETNLKAYSKQVDNYLFLKMHYQAMQLQQAHLDLCDQVYSESGGTLLGLDACLMSRIKLVSILLDMAQYSNALECTLEALELAGDSDLYDVIGEQFALCCVRLDMTEDAVRRLIKERLSPAAFDDSPHRELMQKFEDCRSKTTAQDAASTQTDSRTEDKTRIAQYGELAISLFEELIRSETAGACPHDLILGYERILNYCKHLGLQGKVAQTCISRIAELGSGENGEAVPEDSGLTHALKIYLGQALPQTGEFDVFLSFKSEDVLLAQKVYDYLTQSGKVVFFSKETLPQLGDSEYEERIYEAIDQSKHMVLIGSNPDYLKTAWVKEEWSTFNNEIREGRKTGNLILVLSDGIAGDKGRLPGQLRQKEIVKMSEFRDRLLSYLR